MCKKSKLTAANLLAQTQATELSETQSRLVEVEQANTSLTQKVSELTTCTAVIDLKSMLKFAKASSPVAHKPQPAAAEIDVKMQEPTTCRDTQKRNASAAYTHTMM